MMGTLRPEPFAGSLEPLGVDGERRNLHSYRAASQTVNPPFLEDNLVAEGNDLTSPEGNWACELARAEEA